jgi:hypothetical protein
MKTESVPHPAGGVEAAREKGPSLEVVDTTVDANPEYVDMDAYRRNVPLWKRIWQHSLTQMMLLSVQAFCGPAMDDAIAGRPFLEFLCCCAVYTDLSLGLGGGGLATPQTSNTAYVPSSNVLQLETFAN